MVNYKFKKPKTKPVNVISQFKNNKVAKHWGMKPWEFRELPPERAGELIATYDIENEIEAYYSQEHSKGLDKEERSRKDVHQKVPISSMFRKFS